MTRFENPLAPRTNRFQARSGEIKRWVREVLGLPDDTLITVAELACSDAGCPDPETVIGVFHTGPPTRTLRIHAAMNDVFGDYIEQLCQPTELAMRPVPAGVDGLSSTPLEPSSETFQNELAPGFAAFQNCMGLQKRCRIDFAQSLRRR